MLELKHLCFEAETDDGVRQILKDVSLTVDERMVVITGPNGSGKSTMAKLIAGIEQPTSGQILLDGTLDELKSRNARVRRINVLYAGGYFDLPEGVILTSDENGHAAFTVDTRVCSVSYAIEQLSRHAEITDLSVEGATAEELVVSLYEEFAI